MKNHSAVILLLSKSLEFEGQKPLYRQICDVLREAILSRRLRAGTNLPSTRSLARELSVSRNTVMSAFDQLIAEGYLKGEQGNGTFVADELPDEILRFRFKKVFDNHQAHAKVELSKRGSEIEQIPFRVERDSDNTRAFSIGYADISEFPLEVWKRLLARNIRNMSRAMLGYDGVLGYPPLRAAIAAYLKTSKGIECETSQIIIISGSQQGLDLTARILLEDGDEVLIEDPNLTGKHGGAFATKTKISPIPVDENGLNVSEISRLATNPRAALITPASQFPTGFTMSLSRRLELLEWAEANNAWIIEDDYSSEFHYGSRPIAPVQAMDLGGRVIYIGTFSKTMFPALRLGYLVVPPNFVDAFRRAIAFTSRQPSFLEQITLSNFISEGFFGKHIRSIRAIYAERRSCLIELIERNLVDFIEIKRSEAGMHLVGELRNKLCGRKLVERAAQKGLFLSAISEYCINAKIPDALLFGFTSITTNEMAPGVAALREILECSN